MLNSFEISKNLVGKYHNNYKLNDNLYFNYDSIDLFYESKDGDNQILMYGYCFDVRNPQTDINNTLKLLLEHTENILEEIKYLNGHFILMYNVDGNWQLITDAVSITPVYVDKENQRIITEESNGLLSLNGFMLLNLNDYSVSRLDLPTNKLSDERTERIILDLIVNQYQYFVDKEVTLNFRRNKMNKVIIATLHTALLNQNLNLRENDDLTLKVGKWISRDYKMNLLDPSTNPNSLYVANTHLLDFNTYMDKDTSLSNDELADFNHQMLLNNEFLKERSSIEYNLLNNLRYRNEKKEYLIYDPFNVVAIQELIYRYNDKKTFKPLDRIISIIHPTIDFYDFAKGETLLQKYNKLKKKNKKLNAEVSKFKVNQEFLRLTDKQGIKVTDNLDGTVQSDGVTIYPASQSISKEEVFEILYPKSGQGMILVESYFNNPKNAHRIKVNLNGEEYDIDAFLDGKFINAASEVNLSMRYERDYDAPSWQKAGKITIKEIE